MTTEQLAKTLDMTLLKPSATRDDILRLCDQARRWNPASVCVQPIWIQTAARALDGSGIAVGSVAGFPTGCTMRPIKAQEIRAAIASGAREIDMVVNLGALKSGDWPTVEKELHDLLETARVSGLENGPATVVTKVILECCYLTEDEKTRGATLVHDLGADFVKTSTGFGPSGATPEDVRLLRAAAGATTGVKAAGGIPDLATALVMLEAGATRIGSSRAVQILEESAKQG
jgi:deoxyribose-phosphate aldolase